MGNHSSDSVPGSRSPSKAEVEWHLWGDSNTLSPGELTTLPYPSSPLDTRDFMYPILAHSFTPLVSSSCINVLPLFPYLQLASCPSLAEILPPLGSFPSCLSWHTSLHVTQHFRFRSQLFLCMSPRRGGTHLIFISPRAPCTVPGLSQVFNKYF